MKLGFLTSALPGKTLDELVEWGAKEGFASMEVACWPCSYENRRYAGTQHIDAAALDDAEIERIRTLLSNSNMEISALAYYPNPMTPDLEARRICHEHLRKVILASSRLGVNMVGTFIGRDKNMNVSDTLAAYPKVFGPLIDYAADCGVKLAIENCPMLWEDRWPGGNNIMTTPEIWERVFDAYPSEHIGLNLDPSHLVWQDIDYVKAVHEFSDRIFHVHAKDTRMLYDRRKRSGIYGFGNYVDKLAGLGDIDWRVFFSALYEVGYQGSVAIEHEDRAWEGSEAIVMSGIKLSKRLIGQYVAR
ncbi:MAG TPA: sugar phosphate isomerase/epimerase [Candidatus Limiplasma sp.]|nr:sugar phosphate isomerase/epimerase [Candidatus Limiplasma sp.]